MYKKKWRIFGLQLLVVIYCITLEICPFQHQRCSRKISSVEVNSVTIFPKKCAKSLGFYYDDKLSLNKQINEVVKICNYRLKNLYRIGSKLTKPLKHQLIQSYVLSSLDYCNATYCGFNSSLVSKLQTVQNKCARLVFGEKKSASLRNSTLTMRKDLHMLPVAFRSQYKIAILIFKCLSNEASDYLQNLISLKQKNSEYDLRPESQLYLLNAPTLFPKFNKSKFGFKYIAPTIWNKLPLNICCTKNFSVFKNMLKITLH